jgi:hypothetical protein
MDESPPEIGIKLDFLAKDIRNEFIRLFQKCLTSRSYGMEHRMDHNRDLLTLRIFMRDKVTPHFERVDTEFDFDTVCGWLDYSPDDARRRIARVQTWDMIRNHLEANGSPIRMPAVEAHIDALFGLAQEQRGPAWAQFYDASIAARVPITSSTIKTWVENYKALPVETEPVDDEPKDIEFEDEPEKPEISQEEVPRGIKEAVAVDVRPESGPLTQAPGQGPLFQHPEKVRVAIEKIALACGGDDLERRAEWRAILKDPVKIAFIDVLEWAEYGSDDIRRIASLATGNLHKGLRTAMRIIKGVIDARTTLNFLVNRCRAEGGRLEHAYGPYKIVITYHKNEDYDAT